MQDAIIFVVCRGAAGPRTNHFCLRRTAPGAGPHPRSGGRPPDGSVGYGSRNIVSEPVVPLKVLTESSNPIMPPPPHVHSGSAAVGVSVARISPTENSNVNF